MDKRAVILPLVALCSFACVPGTDHRKEDWGKAIGRLRDSNPAHRRVAAGTLRDIADEYRMSVRTPGQLQSLQEDIGFMMSVIQNKKEDPETRAWLVHV